MIGILQDNVTLAVPITETSTITYNIREGTVADPVGHESEQSSQNQSYDKITADTTKNDILTRFNITSVLNNTMSKPSKVAHNGEFVLPVTTQRPLSYSRRPIYIRGHLLYHPSPDKRTFHPSEGSHGALRAPNSIHLSRADNLRGEPDSKNNRKKRKQSPSKDRFYNYNTFLDTLKVCIVLT
jgi:hypothetical protein